jgi:geranylgeranyl diphosphate synthase type II
VDKATILSRIEEKLDALIPESSVPYRALFSAARYSLLGAGKRLRPLLLIATVDALGGDIERAFKSACALEMVHTYSMIHDDLPCMDDDDFRRNKPTLHKAFPEAHAVLAGDFLLTQAFLTIATDGMLSDEMRIKLITVLAASSGSEGMIGGQIMDIEAEGLQLSLQNIEMIHAYKTGQLITAAMEMGGIIAHANAAHMQLLRSYGAGIGLAFQITDDIIDVTNSEQKHGRKLSSDAINNKTTYVTLMGVDVALQKAQKLVLEAKCALEQLPWPTPLLHEIADTILSRNH